MRLLDSLFVGADVKELETVLYSLRRRIPVARLYCIVLFEDKKRMEIMVSRQLFTPKYADRPYVIAGIAMGRQVAVEVFCFLLEEAVREGRDLTKPEEWIR